MLKKGIRFATNIDTTAGLSSVLARVNSLAKSISMWKQISWSCSTCKFHPMRVFYIRSNLHGVGNGFATRKICNIKGKLELVRLSLINIHV